MSIMHKKVTMAVKSIFHIHTIIKKKLNIMISYSITSSKNTKGILTKKSESEAGHTHTRTKHAHIHTYTHEVVLISKLIHRSVGRLFIMSTQICKCVHLNLYS